MSTTVTSTFPAVRERLQASLLAAYPELIARLSWERPRLLAHQGALLRDLLAHAVEHSPYHARRLAGIDLDAVHPGDLSALPVMTKDAMMADLDAVLTDRRLRRADVEAALAATRDEPVPLPGEHIALASGGSSGRRGVFVLSLEFLTQFVGSMTRNLVARLDAAGGPPPGGLPIAMVGAGSAVHATGLAEPLTQGGSMPVRWHAVPATLPVPEIVARLNTMRPPALFGYPTVLARLADDRRAGRLEIAPAAVTSTSEPLTADLRARIGAGFGVPIVDAFGATEGLAGGSPPGDDVLVFAEDGCIVELVDADNRPVPPGVPSTKVLVTNLYNLVQPLIRYELADSFVAEPAAALDGRFPGSVRSSLTGARHDAPSPSASGGYLRARVRGRADDVFSYGPIDVHPHVVRSVLVQDADVVEYQVRQTPRGVDVDAVAGPGLDAGALADELAAALAEAGLPGPRAVVRRIDALARHPQTGKLARFVPLR